MMVYIHEDVKKRKKTQRINLIIFVTKGIIPSLKEDRKLLA